MRIMEDGVAYYCDHCDKRLSPDDILWPPICPGVSELRLVAARIYGLRVERGLVAKLKGVPGLMQANRKSDLFCIEVPAMENSPEGAVKCFREIVAKAGLGHHFGVAADGGVK
jgi:hypothetical protein